ncbi:shikimate dehydrogenase [Nocardioides sp.]|uniref:shikimate dehydrogenase n=1 Tax=Nocardioides sp. TaxID=35761 RepID=UPI003527E1DC
MRHCGVLGDPIEHSLSPVLHRAGYAALGLDWSYDAHRVSSGGLREFLAGLDGSWRGLSLTMPLKREAMALVDEASELAELGGAANTLLLGEGVVRGDNTDIPGAEAALRERYAGPVGHAAILGGGATAASTLLALARQGCRSFVLHVRDAARAAETLAAAERFGGLEVSIAPLDVAPEGDLLVSTIPATAQTPDLVAGCARVPVLFEVLYDPWPTPLAASAGDRVLVRGLDLLVHQAALQFEQFTELPAPLLEMRQAGEAALRERLDEGT